MAEKTVGALLVVLLPIQSLHIFSRSFDVGIVFAVVLAPLLVASALSWRAVSRLFTLLLVCALFGLALAEFSGTEGRAVNRAYEFGIIGLLVGGALAVGVFAWVRQFLSVPTVAALYAAGIVIDGLIDPALRQNNAWKYAFGWPIAVLLLAATSGRKKTASLLALAAIGGFSAAHQDRSGVGFCLVAGGIFLWGQRGTVQVKRPGSALHTIGGVAILALVAAAVYQGGTYLALTGVLGKDTQARTQKNVRSGESPIAAGRPEGSATFALIEKRPLGLGPGVTPSNAELLAAKGALARRGVDTESSYVNDYMFGGHVELHSIAADLWVSFGFIGLLTAAYMIIGILRGLSRRLSSPLVIFVAVAALWDMAFSPLPSALPRTLFAFCLLAQLLSADTSLSRSPELRDAHQ